MILLFKIGTKDVKRLMKFTLIRRNVTHESPIKT